MRRHDFISFSGDGAVAWSCTERAISGDTADRISPHLQAPETTENAVAAIRKSLSEANRLPVGGA
jgi:hypothetical protein